MVYFESHGEKRELYAGSEEQEKGSGEAEEEISTKRERGVNSRARTKLERGANLVICERGARFFLIVRSRLNARIFQITNLIYRCTLNAPRITAPANEQLLRERRTAP